MQNIICLTGKEIQTFLPEGRLEKLEGLLEGSTICDPSAFSADEWFSILSEKNPEILIAGWETPPLPEDLSAIAPNLKYVCYMPGSIRHLVTRKHIEDGLLVTNWSGSISRTISECALLLTLCCMRDVSHWADQMHFKNGWKNRETLNTQSLFDRRVGLHGFGGISRDLVALLKPFTNKISTFSPSVPDEMLADYGVSRAETLEDLFSQNDVIIELAALTPKNEGIVTEELLRLIPENGAFVNVGRGAVTDEAAVAKVAAEGRIKVALDVYVEEPLPEDSPFRANPNIVLLPHLGGPTIDRRKDAGDFGIENVRRYKAGEELVDVIDERIYDRST